MNESASLHICTFLWLMIFDLWQTIILKMISTSALKYCWFLFFLKLCLEFHKISLPHWSLFLNFLSSQLQVVAVLLSIQTYRNTEDDLSVRCRILLDFIRPKVMPRILQIFIAPLIPISEFFIIVIAHRSCSSAYWAFALEYCFYRS